MEEELKLPQIKTMAPIPSIIETREEHKKFPLIKNTAAQNSDSKKEKPKRSRRRSFSDEFKTSVDAANKAGLEEQQKKDPSSSLPLQAEKEEEDNTTRASFSSSSASEKSESTTHLFRVSNLVIFINSNVDPSAQDPGLTRLAKRLLDDTLSACNIGRHGKFCFNKAVIDQRSGNLILSFNPFWGIQFQDGRVVGFSAIGHIENDRSLSPKEILYAVPHLLLIPALDS
jgi:hypothetical protein